MQRALLGSTLQVTKLNEVLKLCVAAAAPSPEEGAPVGPDTNVEELEEEPSGWRTEHASNFFQHRLGLLSLCGTPERLCGLGNVTDDTVVSEETGEL